MKLTKNGISKAAFSIRWKGRPEDISQGIFKSHKELWLKPKKTRPVGLQAL
jgi:hypothetical protein